MACIRLMFQSRRRKLPSKVHITGKDVSGCTGGCLDLSLRVQDFVVVAAGEVHALTQCTVAEHLTCAISSVTRRPKLASKLASVVGTRALAGA